MRAKFRLQAFDAMAFFREAEQTLAAPTIHKEVRVCMCVYVDIDCLVSVCEFNEHVGSLLFFITYLCLFGAFLSSGRAFKCSTQLASWVHLPDNVVLERARAVRNANL